MDGMLVPPPPFQLKPIPGWEMVFRSGPLGGDQTMRAEPGLRASV